MDQLAADLQRRLEEGEVMYVHCWGGRGRAGTVGACLLIRAYKISAEEALVRVQRAFDTRGDGGRPHLPLLVCRLTCMLPRDLFAVKTIFL